MTCNRRRRVGRRAIQGRRLSPRSAAGAEQHLITADERRHRKYGGNFTSVLLICSPAPYTPAAPTSVARRRQGGNALSATGDLHYRRTASGSTTALSAALHHHASPGTMAATLPARVGMKRHPQCRSRRPQAMRHAIARRDGAAAISPEAFSCHHFGNAHR